MFRNIGADGALFVEAVCVMWLRVCFVLGRGLKRACMVMMRDIVAERYNHLRVLLNVRKRLTSLYV